MQNSEQFYLLWAACRKSEEISDMLLTSTMVKSLTYVLQFASCLIVYCFPETEFSGRVGSEPDDRLFDNRSRMVSLYISNIEA